MNDDVETEETLETGASLGMRRESMRIEGTYTFAASAERVFAALADPDVLRQVIPGCERLIQFGPPAEDGAYRFEARVRPGAESGVYITTGAVDRVRKPSHLALSLSAKGTTGTVPLRGTLDLVTQDDRTVAAYAWDVDLRSLSDTPAADELQPVAERYAREICERIAATLRADRPELNGLDEALPLLRADSARGKIVLLPPEPPETLATRLSPAMRGAIWTAAGLAVGAAGIAVAASIFRRWGRAAGKH